MVKPIVRLFELLLRFLLPPVGRHRQGGVNPNRVPSDRRRLVVCHSALPLAAEPPPAWPRMVSPCVRSRAQAEYERWERTEQRLRRQRRRALWLAMHGVDVGPRVIHGVAVTR